MKQELISKWAESEVTKTLLAEVKREIIRIRATPITDCLYAGDPVKTHENVVELEARERVWLEWEFFLAGDWSYFEDEDE